MSGLKSVHSLCTILPTIHYKNTNCVNINGLVKQREEKSASSGDYRANFSEALEGGLPSTTAATPAPQTAAPTVAQSVAAAAVRGLLVRPGPEGAVPHILST